MNNFTINPFLRRFLLSALMFLLVTNFSFSYERVVSLSPSGTEILFALGLNDKLVARTDFCNFPEEAKKIDSVGGFDGKSFSIETVLSFSPDFVYLTNGMHNHLINTLESLGIKVYLSDVNSIEDIYKEITEVSKLFGIEKIGKQYVDKMSLELSNIKKDNVQKTIYCEIFNSPFLTCGKNSFINDIIEYAGGKNIFDFLDSSYPQVSEEIIIVSNPQIILAPDYSETDLEKIYYRNAWQNIDAIKNKKVFSVSGDIFTRPGPRVIEAVKLLKEILNEN